MNLNNVIVEESLPEAGIKTQFNQNTESQNKENLLNLFEVLDSKFNANKLPNIISQACRVYGSGYLTEQKFCLIQSAFEVKHPTIQKEDIVKQLYFYFRNKKKISNQLDFVVDFMKQFLQNFDVTYAIQNLHQYFTIQGSVPQKDFEALEPLSYIPQRKVRRKQKQKQRQKQNPFKVTPTNQVYQNNFLQEYKYFINKKDQNTYLKPKKIVHVFSKKGYGVELYKQFLQKRQMNNKQWQFYQKELVQQKKYDFYLFKGIRATLQTIMDFMSKTKKYRASTEMYTKPLDNEQFVHVRIKISELSQDMINLLKSCMRIVYDLAPENRISCQKLEQFYLKIISIRNAFHAKRNGQSEQNQDDFFNQIQ